ncbi:MAG TPA: iron-regulated protein, partial [Bacteroidales bacterium]|nr:iron-regulated protein [Bacteroidales bacterium]
MKHILTLLIISLTLNLSAQDKLAYKVFTGEGKKADYGDILKASLKADVVFFGELHDNPIAHWLEVEITKDLWSAKGKNLMLAAEMFETDNQLIIDEYFAGTIKESSFESEARLWTNYKTDYKPLLNFARENGLKFVASNIPRRYASVVASGGFEALSALSPLALDYIAPLPIEYDPELPCYKDMLSMGGEIGGPMAKNVSQNLPRAQAVKDATMANSILKYRQPSQTVIHFNGSYHSDRYMGIIWYLNKYNPGLKIVTLTTVLQDKTDKMDDESLGKADFIIVIPSSMTRT